MENPYQSPGIKSETSGRPRWKVILYLSAWIASCLLCAWIGMRYGYQLGHYDGGGDIEHFTPIIPPLGR